MKSLLIYGFLTISGIIGVVKLFGDVPEPKIMGVVAENVAVPTHTVKPTPTIKTVFPTSKPFPTFTIRPYNSPTPKIVECSVDKDGNKMLEIEECRKLVNERNEAIRKRNEEILAENKKLLEQFTNDMAAYEAKRKELYEECINQPLQAYTRNSLPYYGAGYIVPNRGSDRSGQIIEECKRIYGYEDPTPTTTQ